jgi:hypothetical protein
VTLVGIRVGRLLGSAVVNILVEIYVGCAELMMVDASVGSVVMVRSEIEMLVVVIVCACNKSFE